MKRDVNFRDLDAMKNVVPEARAAWDAGNLRALTDLWVALVHPIQLAELSPHHPLWQTCIFLGDAIDRLGYALMTDEQWHASLQRYREVRAMDAFTETAAAKQQQWPA